MDFHSFFTTITYYYYYLSGWCTGGALWCVLENLTLQNDSLSLYSQPVPLM